MKRRLFILMLAACSLLSCADGIWDAIHGLEDKYSDLDARVAYLEELCREMNTNISALQTLVSVILTNDYIISIAPITKDGQEIGYVITFAIHEPITIYHGHDGHDGQDGTTPIIGVELDPTDNAYYWTLNGEWLLDENGNRIPLTSRDGQDGEDGTDGEDGKDGADGQDGKDGVTPQLKIEDGYWYLSTDNGATWTKLGKATGEDGKDGQDGENGADGKDGQDGEKGEKGDPGDTMFQSVTQDENYVFFTLADGTVIKIAKEDDRQPSGEDFIDFEDVNTLAALLEVGVDLNNDGYISYNEAARVDTLILAKTSIILFKEFKYFTNISYFNFKECKALLYIELPMNICSIPDECFASCQKLKSIQIFDSCTTIGASSFSACCGLQNVVLPSKLKRIGTNAFSGCSALERIDIPNSVAYIGAGALSYLRVDTITFPEDYVADPIGNLWNPNLTTIVWNSISYFSDYTNGLGCYYSSSNNLANSAIRNIILGEKVESLPRYFCSHMRNITIYSQNKVPPKIDEYYTFDQTDISRIYVPVEAVESYGLKWSKYANKIVGYDFE